MSIKLSIKQVLYFLLAIFSFSSYASIQIGSTRVIYREAEKDVSVQVNNPGGYPVLLQSWMDDGRTDIKPENISSPFILTPPLTRVNANEGQTLRLSYIGKSLAADRESVYWLNVLEIPPAASKETNQIQVAFRSRIKVFYRPTGLEDKAALSAAKSLQWVVQGKEITLTNPTPFYISLLSVSIKANGKTTTIPADMIAPKSSKTFELTQSIAPGQLPGVAVEFINDYGAVTSQSLVQ